MVILGINDSHDASAVLFKNGKVLGYLQEERLARSKSIGSFPFRSIEFLLYNFSIRKKDIDLIAVANKNLPFTNAWNLVPELSIADHKKLQNEYWYPIIYKKKNIKLKNVLKNFKPKNKLFYPLSEVPFKFSVEAGINELSNFQKYRESLICNYFEIDRKKIEFFDHHKCHAFYGYFLNKDNFRKNINVVTADGGGDKYNGSIFHFGEEINEISRTNNNRIGRIYESITLMANMHPMFHPYKLMGLAGYSKDYDLKKAIKVFEDSLDVKGLNFKFNYKDEYHAFEKKLHDVRFDALAGGVQKFTENTLIKWFKNIKNFTGTKNFVFNGGVANNIKANQKLVNQNFVNSFFVPVGPGDENLALGAVYSAIEKHNGFSKSKKIISGEKFAYWGVKLKQDNSFSKYLQKKFIKTKDKNLKKSAQIINKGKIILFFNGNMEFGPRGLGNRSIIAHPNNLETLNKLNLHIKKRDFWMPFAPAIIYEDRKKYLSLSKNVNYNYMTVGAAPKKNQRKNLYSVIHQGDFSTRPFLVEKNSNSNFYKLIKNFKKLSSIGVVLNTSLNVHGKPIVFLEKDLNEILNASKNLIEYIFINGFLYKKK